MFFQQHGVGMILIFAGVEQGQEFGRFMFFNERINVFILFQLRFVPLLELLP